MDWYYVQNGQRVGPVPETQFATLITSGHITADTMVWRQGMANWELYRTVNPAAAVPQPPVMPGGPQWGASLGRYGSSLMMTHNAVLPNRCVKCNMTTQRRLRRNLSWHSPFLYLLVFSPIIYIIVALIVRKTAIVDVGICEAHFKKRRTAMLISWLVVLLGVGLIVAAIAMQNGWTALVGVACLLGAAIYAAIACPMVRAGRIDQFVQLGGVCPEYLAELPQWPYQR